MGASRCAFAIPAVSIPVDVELPDLSTPVLPLPRRPPLPDFPGLVAPPIDVSIPVDVELPDLSAPVLPLPHIPSCPLDANPE